MASAFGAVTPVAGGFGVEVSDLLFILNDFKSRLFDNRNDRQRAAARVGAIGTQTIMHFIRGLGVLEANWIFFASAASQRFDCSGHLDSPSSWLIQDD
jgi:hypothetical protein